MLTKNFLSQGDWIFMSDYLTKEEIRKWRSSLERITLEEYAARLGKIIQEEKHDDSLVDSVMLKSLNSMSQESYHPKTEKIQSLAIKSFNKEKEIHAKKIVKVQEKEPMQVAETVETAEFVEPVINEVTEVQKIEEIKEPEKTTEPMPVVNEEVEQQIEQAAEEEVINYSFSKALTSREQIVFDYFLANKNQIVYAKDLAAILELPRDYVYKYIKNLRSKLNEDILQNADNGGYLLKV